MMAHKTIGIILITISASVTAQTYIDADPFYLLANEKTYFSGSNDYGSLLFRPLFKTFQHPHSSWSVRLKTEFFRNQNAPNLENTSVRWIGKGISEYKSVSISYLGQHLAFSIEPYRFFSQNKDYNVPVRVGLYSKLNDMRPFSEKPLYLSGVRETQIFLHHQGFSLGISNANMWWGPGLHSSLQMSNNAPGFRYFSLGTLDEKRINNIGFNMKYVFTQMDFRNKGEPYFTALLFSSTYYNNPQFTVGFSRSYLSGSGTNEAVPGSWAYISSKNAMMLPFEELFLKDKQTDPEDPDSSVDLWDEILVGYLVASFPNSGLKIYIEYGRDDHAWDKDDFIRQPDHSGAGVFGLRKYGLFDRENLVGGLEYTTLIKSKFWTKRVPGTWYSKGVYDNNSYNGRWWGAHSGPDSDDFYIYFGYMGEKFSIIPAFNYERHGVIDNTALVLEKRPYLIYNPDTGRWVAEIVEQWRERQVNIWPEVKIEFRLDVRYRFKGFDFNFFYEDEVVDNLEFNWGERRGEVWWIGIERTIDSEDFRAFRKRKLP
jgi:hypothetical protein